MTEYKKREIERKRERDRIRESEANLLGTPYPVNVWRMSTSFMECSLISERKRDSERERERDFRL